MLHVNAADGVAVDTAVVKIRNQEATAGDNFGLYVQAGSNSSDISFRVADKDDNEYLRVRGDGNVGIGTASPTANLEIGSDGAGEKTLKIHSDTASSYFEIESLGNIARLKATNNTNFMLRSDGGGGYITNWTNGAERVRITSAGNVGIGTTSPSEKLEVSGNIKASGTLVGKTRNVYNANFVADLGTTEYFVPLSTNVETTQAHQEESAMLMPYDGRLVNVMFRTNSDIAHSDATLTVKLYKCTAGNNAQSSSNFTAVGTAATHTIQAGDDHHVFNFACNADNTFSHTDLVAVSVQSNVDMHNSAKFVYCTVIFEYDLNTELTTTTEYDSTP